MQFTNKGFTYMALVNVRIINEQFVILIENITICCIIHFKTLKKTLDFVFVICIVRSVLYNFLLQKSYVSI